MRHQSTSKAELRRNSCVQLFSISFKDHSQALIDLNRDETSRGPNEKREYKSVYMNEKQQYSGWSFPGKRSHLSLGLDRLNY